MPGCRKRRTSVKYHAICPPQKLTVRRATVPAMLEDGSLLERFERHGWIAPIKRASRKGECDLFSVRQLENAVRRMETELLPD